MQVEKITDKEAICLIIMYVIGTSLIIGIGAEAKNDAWIAGIVGFIMVAPMLLVYSRILSLFQGKNLFEILEITLGKISGKIISVIYIWYAFHLGAMVLRNFGEFINIVALPETPMIVPLLCIGLTCIFAAKLGVEVLARTTTFFLPIIIFILVLVYGLSLSRMNISYLKPFFGNGLIPILKGGFEGFSFPFAESVLFIGALSLKTKKSPYKVYFWGVAIATVFIIISLIRNTAILNNLLGSFYFPSYEAVSMISIGDFLQRIEVTVSVVFFTGVFIKASICLLFACKGIGKVFNLSDYRSIVVQTGLLMIFFSYTIYDNSMEMKYWAYKVYPYYAFPFQVILPILIWIFAEFKAKKLNQQDLNSNTI